MLIDLKPTAFNAWQELADYQSQLALKGQFGATASFVGSMRDFNQEQKVYSLFLEHYPEMTCKQLHAIADAAMTKWQLLDILILHRIGTVKVGEDIVLVATWSPHRAAAFASCRQLMEALKSTVPFWKKEQTTTGSHWVEKNTPA